MRVVSTSGAQKGTARIDEMAEDEYGAWANWKKYCTCYMYNTHTHTVQYTNYS